MADDFDLWELIAAPIKAMNEAEAAAATRFVELLLDHALEPPTPAASTAKANSVAPAPTRLRELSFQLRRPNAQGQTETRQITLPMLQLLPIGGVSINEATLTYGLSMSATRGLNPGTRRLAAEGAGTATLPRFAGRLAQTSGLRSTGDGAPATDANISIEMRLKQIDLPQGVLDLLQHTQGGSDDAIAPGTVSAVPLFTAEVLGMSGKTIVAGERFSLRVRMTPSGQLSSPLHLSLSSQPDNALRFLGPGAELEVTAAKEVELEVLVSKAVKSYKPDTPVAMVIHGSSLDGRGLPLGFTTSLVLPRNP